METVPSSAVLTSLHQLLYLLKFSIKTGLTKRVAYTGVEYPTFSPAGILLPQHFEEGRKRSIRVWGEHTPALTADGSEWEMACLRAAWQQANLRQIYVSLDGLMFNKSFPYNHRNIRKPVKKATVKLFRKKSVEVTNLVTEHKEETTAACSLVQDRGNCWVSVVYH